MGICPSLQPEARVIHQKNQEIVELFHKNLEEMLQYGFVSHISKALKEIQPRYLYNEGILEDIQKIFNKTKQSVMRRSSYGSQMNFQEQIKNSCLILQNEEIMPELDFNLNQQKNMNYKDSFQRNLMKNESLVVQINILYSKEIKKSDYSEALYLFLKWGQIFQEHSYGGFLKPIYREFCKYMYTIPKHDFSTIIDEMSAFVQLMVAIVTSVYSLNVLVSFQHGKLIKNQNVYNLIMSYLFKKTRIKHFLIGCIQKNEQAKIIRFQKQLLLYHKRSTQFFGISKKFRLHQSGMTESEIYQSIEVKDYVQPYATSLKLVNQLCGKGSPITKLKTIVNISKEIVNQIRSFYQKRQQEYPELDPDNLSSIVMYLIVKNSTSLIYEQLKMVQNFTTTNCLNCISGYYLNVFGAAIESILQLNQP